VPFVVPEDLVERLRLYRKLKAYLI